MATNGKERISTTDELLRAHAHVWNHTFAFVSSACLKCAVQLGIPDIIHRHGQPMKLSQLVASLPALNPSKSHCIRRLMRVLAHDGFFVELKAAAAAGEEEEPEYTLTPASHLLLRTTPASVSPFLLLMLDPLMVKPLNCLTPWLGNDDPTPFLTANGQTIWDYAGQNPAFNSLFNEGMESDSRMVASVVIEECRGAFEGLSSLVDVGGGTGTMAKAIAEAFPEMKCTVLDLPQVVDKLPGRKNLFFTPGNMFEAIPPANAILLKWILHDWADEDCVKILRHCREAIPSREKGGKVIIIDVVVGHQKLEETDANDDKSTQTQLFMDMLVMVLYSSKERTEKEWANLFSVAGFSDYKINPILGLRSLIEIYP
ncbi:trans-resveratrol di-O-methyltransferase-like [Diospyros lotus]|uniref:trans-resveratrol di-O-methyltransferase-like n=1 Tax=Diospyros lotus TaxID=55363 RepID=UPI0022561748|nr:trans-resveratrol di-O-methyltransferase-like [Diospyros lotus]